MASQHLADYLRFRMNELELSNTEVAERAGISRQTWYRLINKEIEEARLSTFIHLAVALRTTPLKLLSIYFQCSYPRESINHSDHHTDAEHHTRSAL